MKKLSNRSKKYQNWKNGVQQKGRGVCGKGLRLKGSKQYKLFDFISRHFGGNISKAARELGYTQPHLYKIVTKGSLKRKTIEGLVAKIQTIDPGQTEESLFIPPQIVPKKSPKKAIKKIPTVDIPVIRPSMGGFVSIGTGLLSSAIARARDQI